MIPRRRAHTLRAYVPPVPPSEQPTRESRQAQRLLRPGKGELGYTVCAWGAQGPWLMAVSPPSPNATRHRPLDDGEVSEPKRRPVEGDFGPDGPALKILVPNQATGSIIGRGGSVISAIQAECGCRIRISQNKMFFPGTQVGQKHAATGPTPMCSGEP